MKHPPEEQAMNRCNMGAMPGDMELFRLAVRRVYVFRIWAYLGVLLLFAQFLMVQAIWRSAYNDRESIDGVSLDTMIAYLSTAALLNFVVQTVVADEIQRRIEDGQVAADLLRPVGFLRQMVILSLGESAGRTLLLVVVVPGLLIMGSFPISSPPNTALFLISTSLGYVLNTALWMVIGLTGFWLLNISGMKSLLLIASQFFSGSLIPLWFMPNVLRVVAEWLPFQAVVYVPAAVYTQQLTGSAAHRAIVNQGLWVLFLCVLCQYLWSRARRVIVIQGG